MNSPTNEARTREAKATWVAIAITCMTLSVLWSWYVGKDLNWDSLNYHFYVAYQWAENRLPRDFLAASIQSYLNPLAYVPFYWMVTANWPSLVIGSVLAAFHALNLILIAWLTALLVPSTTRYRFFWIACAILLAAINPIFASEIGSTFNDISTSVFVLAGYVLCIRAIAVPDNPAHGGRRGGVLRRWGWLWAGICLGLATGLKLTNSVFALGLLPSVFLMGGRHRVIWHRLSAYAIGGILGFVAADGYWAWQLFVQFGNPVFPYFNSLFSSPDFPAFNIRNYRFVPDSLSEALLFPWNALRIAPDIYTEPAAPDTRYLALLLLAALAAAAYLARGWARKTAVPDQSATISWARLQVVLVAWSVSCVLWLYSSGNGRYFIPASLLLGPILVCLALSFAGARRFSIYILALMVTLQFVHVKEGAQRRWAPKDWTDSWFEVRVPDALAQSPYLYLAPGGQPGMFIAPFLHKESSFSNISGQVALSGSGPGGQRVQALIEQSGTRIRSLYPVFHFDASGRPSERAYRMYEGIFERFGLASDPAACETIRVNLGTKGRKESAAAIPEPVPRSALMLSCALVPRPGHLLTAEMAQRIDRAFDRVEQACPRLFSPRGTVTDRISSVWLRRYVNSDIVLAWVPDEQIQYTYYSGGEPVRIGTLENWEKAKVPAVDCAIKSIPPFGITGLF